MSIVVGPEFMCTCPCVDCAAGNHCGGVYMAGVEHPPGSGRIVHTCVGVCHYPGPDDDETDYWWTGDEEEDGFDLD